MPNGWREIVTYRLAEQVAGKTVWRNFSFTVVSLGGAPEPVAKHETAWERALSTCKAVLESKK